VAVLRDGRLVVVDALEHLRAVAVQRWEVDFAEPVDGEAFRALAGVRDVDITGSRMHIAFEGAPDAVIKALAAHDVRELRVNDDDLEQIFLRFYQESPP
jgi:ABC-2 type transport system ATP-binding protein